MLNNLTRRDMLKKLGTIGAVGVTSALLPSWMPKLAFAQEGQNPSGDVLVCIFLRGGMDGLSAVVPFGDGAHYYDVRPTIAIAEPGRSDQSAVDLDGQFGLHPALRPLKDIYDNGDFAIVHATGSTDETRSHFDAMMFMEYGTPGDKTTESGWLARHLQSTAYRSNSPFRAIGMGAMLPASLRGPVDALALKSIVDYHLAGREDEMRRMQDALARLYVIDNPQRIDQHQAKLVFDTIEQMKAINALGYTPANNAAYPDDEFGMGLKQVAQLIKADVGLEIACIDLGGWDTHEAQGTLDGEFNGLMTTLGQGLSALYTDLGSYNQRVTVATMSEFGRRVEENASYGTDHGHGNVMFVMGGSVNGGRVYADWPTLAPSALADGDLAITTDYRNVLAEIISKRLKNDDLGYIFPNHTVNPLGIVR
ncbi:MAG: DUF1501 domain-containing protein [Anaerolineaceae bacterium]|nr:DUF1501 domain-containing protein [Anaerolineaceae bacterium]